MVLKIKVMTVPGITKGINFRLPKKSSFEMTHNLQRIRLNFLSIYRIFTLFMIILLHKCGTKIIVNSITKSIINLLSYDVIILNSEAYQYFKTDYIIEENMINSNTKVYLFLTWIGREESVKAAFNDASIS